VTSLKWPPRNAHLLHGVAPVHCLIQGSINGPVVGWLALAETATYSSSRY